MIGAGCAASPDTGNDLAPTAGNAGSAGDAGAAGDAGTGGASGASGASGSAGSDSGGYGGDPWGGGSGGGGDGWGKSKFGAACGHDDDCESAQCTDIGQNELYKVCTEPCLPECPASAYCLTHAERGQICVPDRQNQCAVCESNIECINIGDVCAQAPKTDRFCARDCSADGVCPTGFECADPAVYDPEAVVPDAGVAPGVCVPEAGDSCSCDDKRDDIVRMCETDYAGQICQGVESCNASTGEWEGCDAKAPIDELCDGIDNDCDDVVDNGEDADLCSHLAKPNFGDWACEAGQCVIGDCPPGTAFYPPTLPPSAGCSCMIEATEQTGNVRNDTCDTGSFVGATSDTSTAPIVIRGRLTSDADVDWYSFEVIDDDEINTNSYHVEIEFAQPTLNDEFRFDVIRGGSCAVPEASHSGLTNYNWCVNGDDGDKGEATCSKNGPKNCGPHTALYYLAVKRADGFTGTCAEYVLTIKGNGGACDFSNMCDPQVSEL